MADESIKDIISRLKRRRLEIDNRQGTGRLTSKKRKPKVNQIGVATKLENKESELIMKIELLDGKYTAIFEEDTGKLCVLRYDQEWREMTGDEFILALMQRIEDLQNGIDAVTTGTGEVYKKLKDSLELCKFETLDDLTSEKLTTIIESGTAEILWMNAALKEVASILEPFRLPEDSSPIDCLRRLLVPYRDALKKRMAAQSN